MAVSVEFQGITAFQYAVQVSFIGFCFWFIMGLTAYLCFCVRSWFRV